LVDGVAFHSQPQRQANKGPLSGKGSEHESEMRRPPQLGPILPPRSRPIAPVRLMGSASHCSTPD
jgi:hypothetical protein